MVKVGSGQYCEEEGEDQIGGVKRLGIVCIWYFQKEVVKGEKQESRLKKKLGDKCRQTDIKQMRGREERERGKRDKQSKRKKRDGERGREDG